MNGRIQGRHGNSPLLFNFPKYIYRNGSCLLQGHGKLVLIKPVIGTEPVSQ